MPAWTCFLAENILLHSLRYLNPTFNKTDILSCFSSASTEVFSRILSMFSLMRGSIFNALIYLSRMLIISHFKNVRNYHLKLSLSSYLMETMAKCREILSLMYWIRPLFFSAMSQLQNFLKCFHTINWEEKPECIYLLLFFKAN